MSSHSVLANIAETVNDFRSSCRVRAGPVQLMLNTAMASDAMDSFEIRSNSMAMPMKL